MGVGARPARRLSIAALFARVTGRTALICAESTLSHQVVVAADVSSTTLGNGQLPRRRHRPPPPWRVLPPRAPSSPGCPCTADDGQTWRQREIGLQVGIHSKLVRCVRAACVRNKTPSARPPARPLYYCSHSQHAATTPPRPSQGDQTTTPPLAEAMRHGLTSSIIMIVCERDNLDCVPTPNLWRNPPHCRPHSLVIKKLRRAPSGGAKPLSKTRRNRCTHSTPAAPRARAAQVCGGAAGAAGAGRAPAWQAALELLARRRGAHQHWKKTRLGARGCQPGTTSFQTMAWEVQAAGSPCFRLSMARCCRRLATRDTEISARAT